MKTINFAFLFLLITVNSLFAQTTPAYKRSDLPIEERVKDLLQRMTPEEKFWQLFMIPGDLGNDPSRYKKWNLWIPGQYSAATTRSGCTVTQL